MWGWVLMAIGLSALLVIVLTSGDIRDRFTGTGDRRISRRAQLAQQRNRIADLEQQIADCPTCTPPLFPTDEQLVVADALAGPGLDVPAPADDPMSWIHRAAEPKPMTEGPRIQPDAPAVAETYEPADPNAQTQQTNVAALRAGLDATVRLPRIPDRAPAPNALDIPAPHPMASATSIPVTAVNNAVSNIEAVMSEAS